MSLLLIIIKRRGRALLLIIINRRGRALLLIIIIIVVAGHYRPVRGGSAIRAEDSVEQQR